MPELGFKVESARPLTFAMAPTLNFALSITQAGAAGGVDQGIDAIALRCQIRIEPARRKYTPIEQARLRDLFGEPERWGQTLRSQLWTHASMIVPRFSGQTVVELPVPCTFDFNIAATKYFDALQDGLAPLSLLFSGTIFYSTPEHQLHIAQIPWTQEAAFNLPVAVWRQMMEHYYPNSAWLCLRKDAFDRLADFKTRRGLPTWEAAVEALVVEQAGEVS